MNYLSYEDAQAFVQKHNIKTPEEYFKLQKVYPNFLPPDPEKYYSSVKGTTVKRLSRGELEQLLK